MKFLQSLSAQVSLRTQGAILALGLLFIILDALTEPMDPAIDLAWVTVIICGLPLLINLSLIHIFCYFYQKEKVRRYLLPAFIIT